MLSLKLKSARLHRWWRRYKDLKAFQSWKESGKLGAAPHIVKEQAVVFLGKQKACSTFIETGTYLGDMVAAVLPHFSKVYSIELDRNLFETAKKRFVKNSNVEILQGDSGKVIKDLLTNLSGKCLFWLDGHFSGGITAKAEIDTPIMQELEAILNSSLKDSVILIDDARLFVGRNGYPKMEELKIFVLSHNPNLQFEVKDDIIRLIPK